MVKILQRLSIRRSTGKLRAKFNRALGNPISPKKARKKKIFIAIVTVSVISYLLYANQTEVLALCLKLKMNVGDLLSKISNGETSTEIHEEKKILPRRLMFLLTVGIPLLLSLINYLNDNGYNGSNMEEIPKTPKFIPNSNPNKDGSANLDGYPDDWSEWLTKCIKRGGHFYFA